VGKLAQDLLENPLFANTLARAFEAREKAMQAQTVAMGALNLPSAADIERLTRRLRSVSQRLEGIEDGVERLDERLADVSAATDTAERLRRMEEQLEAVKGKYDFSVAVTTGTPPTFTITATAINGQAVDGNLTLNDLGAKTGNW